MEGHAHRTEGTKGNMFISSLMKRKERKKDVPSIKIARFKFQWGKKCKMTV